MTKKYTSKKRLTIFWDTETENGFIGHSIASQWCFVYGDNTTNEPQLYEGYDCILDMFNAIHDLWLELDKPEICLYAHNAAFDLMRTRSQLPNSVFKATLVCGQMVAGKLLYKDMTINCRDSMRLLPESLDKLSKSLTPELPKLQMNHLIGYEIGNPEDQDYAKRDVETLRAVLITFAKIINQPLEKLKFSAAGQAFFMMKKIYEEDNGKYRALPKELNQLFLAKFYFGGRIYIRHNHNPLEICDTESLDITSSYPFQMAEQVFPIPGVKPARLSYVPSAKGRFFVSVKVKDYNNTLPIFPFRKEDGGVIYPHGSFTAQISDIEYYHLRKYDIDTFRRLEVVECLFWGIDKCSKWLKKYIDLYYQLKQEGDRLNKNVKGSGDALRTVAKLLLNSIYGKFAQKYVEQAEEVAWAGGEHLEIFPETNNDHRNAHISAFITAGARCHLYEAIEYYGHENVVYSDTDSIKVYKHVYESKPKMAKEGDYLGSWKPEGEYKGLQVIAPKVYIGIHVEKGEEKLEIKAKGLPMKNITNVIIDGTKTRLARSSVNPDINNKSDKKAAQMIAEAARSLKEVKVSYAHKPLKLKSFVKSGEYAATSLKTMSYPDTVKGMEFNRNVYKIIEINA